MIILHTIGTALIEVAPEHSAERRSKTTRITPRAPMRFALLLYLAVERGLPISRESLASVLLGPNAAGGTYHLLRQMLFELRKLGVPIPRDQREILIPPDQVACDFDRLLYAPAAPAELVRAAVNGFLPGFSPRSEAYREWFDPFYAARSAAISRRLGDEAKAAVREGLWDVAEAAARGCLAVDDLNESANFALAQMLAVNGSKAQAVQLLDRYIERIGAYSPQLTAAALGLREKLGGPVPMRPRASRTANGVAVHETAFVGRSAELAQLQDAFETACYGTPQCVIVTGDPGIGKTRLAAEFSATLGVRRAQCARVGLQQHDADRPMGAFVDLVPTLLELNGALGCSPESLYALKKLTTQRASEAAEDAESAEQHERRWTTVSRAVVELCHSIAFELPLLIEVDDAHWLDSLSATTFGRLVMSKQPSRIVVVATTRDARKLTDEMRAGGRCRMLTVGPLDAAGAAAILDDVLPAEPHRRSNLRSQIASVSVGNPLLLVSLASHSRASNGTFQIPATIVESLTQRIDRLSRSALTVLATCAEFGNHATMRRLSRALELRRFEVVDALLELTAYGLLLRHGQNAAPAHPLVAEALRMHLPSSVRRAVAEGVAKLLEKDAQLVDAPGLWWDAAQSWKTAENPERAVRALRQCARHALDIGRPGEAARILRDAAGLPQPRSILAQVTAELIRVGNTASDYALVLDGARLRARTRRTRRHDDLEVAELRAAVRTTQSSTAFERLVDCASARDVAPSHRVNAALELLKAVEFLGSESVRSQVVDRISAEDLTEVPREIQLEFQLLAAATARDWAGATDAALEILHEIANDCKTAAARFIQNAAIALFFAGRWELSVSAFELAYDRAIEAGSANGQLVSAVQLAGISFDLGFLGPGERWIEVCNRLVDGAPELANDFDLVTTKTLAAFHFGHIAAAEKAQTDADAHGLYSTPARSRWKRALVLAFQLQRNTLTPSHDTVASSIISERVTTLNGVRDFEIGIACQVLAARGHREKAAASLRAFLATERDHFAPLSPSAIRALDGLGMTVPEAYPKLALGRGEFSLARDQP